MGEQRNFNYNSEATPSPVTRSYLESIYGNTTENTDASEEVPVQYIDQFGNYDPMLDYAATFSQEQNQNGQYDSNDGEKSATNEEEVASGQTNLEEQEQQPSKQPDAESDAEGQQSEPESQPSSSETIEPKGQEAGAASEKQGERVSTEEQKPKKSKPEIDKENILYEFSPEEQRAKDYIEDKENGINFFDDSTEVGRNLQHARERLAEATVHARRGKLGSNGKNRKERQELDNAIAEYENARQAFIQEQTSRIKEENEARRQAFITMLGTKETGTLMGGEANYYLSQNHPGKFDKLVDRYNEMTRTGKLVTGIGIAAVGGVVSLGVGAAAAGAGIGAAVSTRFGRNYFSQEAKRRGLSPSDQKKQETAVSYKGNLEQYRNDNDSIKKAQTHSEVIKTLRAESVLNSGSKTVEEDSTEETKSKRKAVRRAVGVTALGGAIGLVVDFGSDIWDGIRGGGAGEQVTPDTETPTPEQEPDTESAPETSPDDISAELGLPEGYIVNTSDGYEVTAMPGSETNSIWRAAEHALQNHLGRKPNVFETDALQDMLGTHRIGVGETVTIKDAQINRALEIARQY